MPAKKDTFTYIDLFAGCGGLSLGLYHAGWHGLFAIEKSPDAFKTLRHNLIDKKQHFSWPSWLPQTNHDINEILAGHRQELIKLRGSVDMVAGGPPCQGFSTAGRRMENDVRNGLIKSYLRFIQYVRPKVIFFENVKGFTLKFGKNKSDGQAYSQYVLATLRRLGYDVEGQMLDFSQFGIPQKRTRFILVAVHQDAGQPSGKVAENFFGMLRDTKKDFLKGKSLPQKPTLKQVLSDLLKSNGVVDCPDRRGFKRGTYNEPSSLFQRYLRKGLEKGATPDSHSYPKHRVEVTERFAYFLKASKGNKNIDKESRNKFNISKHTIIPLAADKPAPTLTTLPDDYIHYCEPRILTVREYARIQTFPDWYEFKGKYTTGGKERVKEVPRYTQIGNAIPPLFGEQSGHVLKQLAI